MNTWDWQALDRGLELLGGGMRGPADWSSAKELRALKKTMFQNEKKVLGRC